MTLATSATSETLIDALSKIDSKAEIIDGEIVLMSPTGALPGFVGDEIFVSLRLYSKEKKYGRAVGDNKGFRVNLPHRESFSPDAAFYVGASPGMGFFEGAPIFAAEVRSEGDYGPQAEQKMRQKRADYFSTGTLVVWDVDPIEEVVHVYRASEPSTSTTYRRGEVAEAEPAVPGWTMLVDLLFDEDEW
ncbi:Uma2 family endonuclease [Chloroflexi bacterium TSY]|nr:Uma2 family endonuclease [Chloroflexi bacterium TSY]